MIAISADVVTMLLVEVIGELITLPLFELFEHILNFEQVISLVIEVIRIEWFHDRLDFKAKNVSQVNFRIDQSFTAITRIMNQ